jgi:hypothetical protein
MILLLEMKRGIAQTAIPLLKEIVYGAFTAAVQKDQGFCLSFRSPDTSALVSDA